ESDAVTTPRIARRRQLGHLLHRESVSCHARELLGDGFMFPDRLTPLHTFVAPPAGDRDHLLSHSGATGGNREPTSVQCDQRELETFSFVPEDILSRDLHIGEPNYAFLEC